MRKYRLGRRGIEERFMTRIKDLVDHIYDLLPALSYHCLFLFSTLAPFSLSFKRVAEYMQDFPSCPASRVALLLRRTKKGNKHATTIYKDMQLH